MTSILATLLISALLLTGCTVSTDSVSKTGQVLSNRVSEFTADTPAAPYTAIADATQLDDAARASKLMISGTQLAYAIAAEDLTGTPAATTAFVIESELRALDDGELERDIFGALAGEDTSIGIAQVKVSTAVGIEEEAPELFGIVTDLSSDTERTALIKRLAADDWSTLYASQYLAMLQNRYSSDQAVDLAIWYTGANPAVTQSRDPDLYKKIADLLGTR